MSYTAQDVIKIADAEVGYLEKATNSNLYDKTANAGYNNWTKYAKELYEACYYNGNKNGYAWCDVVHDWFHYVASGRNAKVAQQVICQTGPYGAGCTYSAQYYRNAGRFYNTPKVGDQIFFGPKGDEYHTGLVYKVDSSRVYTIEGNTSAGSSIVANGGGVFKKSYYLTNKEITGYGRPRYGNELNEATSSSTTNKPMLSQGSAGSSVKELQQNLIKLGYSCGSYGADGDFGNGTKNAVIAFQRANKLDADGIVGPATWSAIEAALKKLSTTTTVTSTYSLTQFIKDVQAATGASVDGIVGPETLRKTVTVSASINASHKVVKPIQKRLYALGYVSVGEADGIAGSKFTAAVKAYQKANGCVADGEITAKNATWKKLLGM